MMRSVKVEELYKLPLNILETVDDGVFNVEFPSGVSVGCTRERALVAWHTWDLNRKYNVTPTPSQFLSMDEYRKGSDKKLFEKAVDTVYYTCIEQDPTLDPRATYIDMMLDVMISKTRLHNYATLNMYQYANSLSAMGFYDIINDPSFKLVSSKIVDNEESITTGIKFAMDEVKEDRFRDNPVSRICRRGIVQGEQATQMYFIRGATTDIDSRIFPHSIMTPYMSGVRDAGYAVIETRQTSKAELYQGDPMRESEYLHRQLQLVVMSMCKVDGSLRVGGDFKRLPSNDCGTASRTMFPVKTQKDLEVLTGLLHTVDGVDRMIRADVDQHLIGTTITLRTPLDCATMHRGHVCAGCCGMYSNIIPEGVNIGLLSTAELMGQIVQAVLSVKHSEGSTSMKELTLNERNGKYFIVGRDKRSFVLKRSLKTAKPYLIVKTQYVDNLSDVLKPDFQDEMSTAKVGSISSVVIEYVDMERNRQRINVPVTLASTRSHFSTELLEHIRANNFETTPKNEYRINLANWDFGKPLLVLEMRHVSMPDFMAQVRTFIMSGSDKGERVTITKMLKDFDVSQDALLAFHRLVNETIDVNIVHLAIIMKSMMCVGERRRGVKEDYRIPLLGEVYRLARYNDIMSNRSASAEMIYQHQDKFIDSVHSYDPSSRPAHPADVSFMA